jgi:hypothetical protein
VTLARPSNALAAGGPQVLVYGVNFVDVAWVVCRFDSTVVAASYLSSSSVVCAAPAHASGTVTLSVSSNNQDFVSWADSFTYTTGAFQHCECAQV